MKTEEVKETISGMKLPFWETREAASTYTHCQKEKSFRFHSVLFLFLPLRCAEESSFVELAEFGLNGAEKKSTDS